MIDIQYTYNKIVLQVYYQANPTFKLETNDGKNIMIHALLIKCDAEHILKICGLDLLIHLYTIKIHNLTKKKKHLFYRVL